MDLKNTVSIVTGGSGGLGGRICHALADEGSHVAVTYNSRPEKASAVASELRAKGVEAEAYRCDVASPEQVEGSCRTCWSASAGSTRSSTTRRTTSGSRSQSWTRDAR